MPAIYQQSAIFATGGVSDPLDIANVRPLSGIQLEVDGVLTVGVAAATLSSAGILAVLKKIQMTVGGEPHMQFGLEGILPGGDFLHVLNYSWFGKLPNVSQPAVAVGANPFHAVLVMPFAGSKILHKHMPKEARQAMTFRREGRSVQLQFDWGANTDIATPGGGGTATVAATVRISPIEDRTLENVPVEAPDDKGNMRPVLNQYHRIFTESIPIATTIASAEQEPLKMARGLTPGILFKSVDNGVVDGDLINLLKIRINGTDIRFDATWQEMIDKSRELSGLQTTFPVGYAWAWFDDDLDSNGYLPLGSRGVAQTLVETDHDASAGGVMRFAALHLYQP